MAQVRSYQMDIYGAWLHLATDRRGWGTLRRRFENVPPADAIGFTSFVVKRDGVHICMFLDMGILDGNNVGLVEMLTHEATHASTMLLDHIGEEYNGQSEALAYLTGFIAAWLWIGCNG